MKVIDSLCPLFIASRLFDDPIKRLQPVQPNKRKRNTTHMGLKIGQGGTLDPLADGVLGESPCQWCVDELVIGVNRGTKHLNQFLECSKDYESTGLLGAATTTYDSEGEVLSTAPWTHVTREAVENVLDRFRGEVDQMPPM